MLHPTQTQYQNPKQQPKRNPYQNIKFLWSFYVTGLIDAAINQVQNSTRLACTIASRSSALLRTEQRVALAGWLVACCFWNVLMWVINYFMLFVYIWNLVIIYGKHFVHVVPPLLRFRLWIFIPVCVVRSDFKYSEEVSIMLIVGQ